MAHLTFKHFSRFNKKWNNFYGIYDSKRKLISFIMSYDDYKNIGLKLGSSRK